MSMSENTIETYGKTFLVLLLPISFLIVFLVNTWRILLLVLVLLMAINLWQQYRWQKWCEQVNPLFYQLIKENQGKITPMDLAIKGNFTGNQAKRYLEAKKQEFGANVLDYDNESPSYYFITASILGNIFDSSEPEEKTTTQPVQPVTDVLQSLLASPVAIPTQEQKEEEEQEPESLLASPVAISTQSQEEDKQEQPESLPLISDEEVQKPLEKQLVFGSLIQSELAKRLGVYSSTVYKRRNDPDFPEWSRIRDPDGIAWSYSRKSREFFPLEE